MYGCTPRYHAYGKRGVTLTVCSILDEAKRMMQVWRPVEVLGLISACCSGLLLLLLWYLGVKLEVVVFACRSLRVNGEVF